MNDRPVRPTLTTIAVMVGTAVSVLGSSTINVALQEIMHGVGATLQNIDWVVTGYMLTMVIAMPVSGWLGNVLGRRNLYALGIGLFTLGSALAGLSWNFPSLVAFRLLQGFGGGLMMPTAQAILFEAHPPEQRGTAMGLFGLGAILGPAIGPTLGGWLVDVLGWRSLFYLSVPFSVAALLMLFPALPNRRHAASARFDAPGFLWLALSLTGLQLGLGNIADQGLTAPDTLLPLGGSLITGLLLLRRERRTPLPLIDFSVFRHSTYNRGVVVSTALGLGLYGGSFLIPLFLGAVTHRSALEIGLLMLPGSLVMGLCMMLSGRLSRRLDARVFICGGLLIFAGSVLALVNTSPSTPGANFVWSLVGRGVGVGLLYAPLSVVTLSPLSSSELGAGSGLFNLTRQLGGTLGIALLKAVLNQRADWYAHHSDTKDLALSLAFGDSFWLVTVMIAVCMFPALLLRAPQHHTSR